MKYFFVAALFCISQMNASQAAEMKIDGSSKEKYERSLKKIFVSLSKADAKIFGIGLMNMIITEHAGSGGKQNIFMMVEAAKAAHITMDGKTVSQILQRGRLLDKKEKEKAKEQNAKIANTPLVDKICGSSGTSKALSVVKWKASPQKMLIGTGIKLVVTFRSNLKNSIRIIDGVVIFEDALGASIGRFVIDRDVKINMNGLYKQTGNYSDSFSGKIQRLLKVRKQDVKAFTCIKAVLFEDGTQKRWVATAN